MNLSHHLQSIRCTRSLLDSETIRDLELRFRNYHSETIPRGKILSAIIGRDSETTIGKLLGAIQELRLGNYFVRFRNYVWKLLGAIQELRLGNYFVRFRNYVWKLFRVIQKLRFGNYHVRSETTVLKSWTHFILTFSTSRLPPPLPCTYIFTRTENRALKRTLL